MSGPKTQRKERETQIKNVEQAAKGELADLVPEVEALSPESIDDSLVQAFDVALESSKARVDEAKLNGNGHKTK